MTTSIDSRRGVLTRTGAAAIGLAVLMSGCAAVPDLAGYKGATIALQQSVQSAGDAVHAELDLTGRSTGSAAIKSSAKSFQKSWKKRVDAMDALVRYAASLEAIAAAGNEGAESVEKLGGAVDSLIKTVGVTPAGAAAGEAAGILKEVVKVGYAEYAKRRAVDSLQASVSATGPIMTEVVSTIDSDLVQVRKALEAATRTQLGDLEVAFEAVTDDRMSARSRLNNSLRFWILVTDDELTKDVPRLTKVKERNELIKQISQRLDALQPDREQYVHARDAIRTRHKRALGLIQATSEGLAAWAKSHADLADALATDTRVDLASLVAATSRILDLVKQWRQT